MGRPSSSADSSTNLSADFILAMRARRIARISALSDISGGLGGNTRVHPLQLRTSPSRRSQSRSFNSSRRNSGFVLASWMMEASITWSSGFVTEILKFFFFCLMTHCHATRTLEQGNRRAMRKTNVTLRMTLWRRGLTITRAAKLIGMRRERLSLIINGHLRPRARERRKIARTLGVPIRRLFPELSPKPRKHPRK